MNTSTQLIDLPGLGTSGIWAEGHQPSLRTMYVWLQEKKVPYHHLPGRRLVSLEAIVIHMRKAAWHWPDHVPRQAEFTKCAPIALQLVRFRGLKEMGLWHPSCLPCDRTLRSMIAKEQIPYYQVARMQFFRLEEVAHCLITHTKVEAA